MRYQTDTSLLPMEVRRLVTALRNALVAHTDYLHIQLTLEDITGDPWTEAMVVIVDDPEPT